MPRASATDVVVIGGGPAGCAIAALLSAWGHEVTLLVHDRPGTPGRAESLPPSARRILQTLGVLDPIARAGFRPNRGNAVWWGGAAPHTVGFDGHEAQPGFQVCRLRLDALLRRHAGQAGARVLTAMVRAASLQEDGAVVEYDHAGTRTVVRGRFVVDASGRAGLIARRGLRRVERSQRMQAYLGMWTRRDRWPDQRDDVTMVETYRDGWAWSLATSESDRHVAVMVDGAVTAVARGSLTRAYHAELAKTQHVGASTRGATLTRVWACDASMYHSSQVAGPQFLLVGDAASCIDPLSSFGVKKALVSGWLGAVTLHTALIDSSRQSAALEHYSRHDRRVYRAELARTREYARRAAAHHAHPFWRVKAESAAASPSVADDEAEADGDPDAVRTAYHALRETDTNTLVWDSSVPLEPFSVVRDREIVIEQGFRLSSGVTRFAAGVDLVALARATAVARTVPDLYDTYCRVAIPAPLPDFLGALSLLVAERVLRV